MAQTRPSRLLAGETPRLIDEWQVAPQLWDAIRYDIDHSHALGKFILTGSAVAPDDKKKKLVKYTETGRFALPITCLTVILIDIPVRSAGGGLHGDFYFSGNDML